MEKKELIALEQEENDKSEDDAKKALAYWRDSKERDLKKLLYYIYGISETNIPTSFVNTGNVKEIALFSLPIVTIFPFNTEKELQQCYKATTEEILNLINEGIIFPWTQPATRYDGLHYLHPILEKMHKDYFTRSVYFYSIFFDDNIDLVNVGRLQFSQTLARLYEKGLQHKMLKEAFLEKNKDGLELYDQGLFTSQVERKKRISENFSYKYASVALFIGEDTINYIFDVLEPSKSLKVLLHLHIVLDHFYTQGLLSHMHDQEYSYLMETKRSVRISDWLTNALAPCSYLLKNSTPINIIPSPSVNEVLEAHENNIPSVYPSTLDQIEEIKAGLDQQILEVNYKIDQIRTDKEKIKKIATISAFVFSGVIGKFKPEGIASMIGSLILPPKIIDMIVDEIIKKIKEANVRKSVNYLHTLWS